MPSINNIYFQIKSLKVISRPNSIRCLQTITSRPSQRLQTLTKLMSRFNGLALKTTMCQLFWCILTVVIKWRRSWQAQDNMLLGLPWSGIIITSLSHLRLQDQFRIFLQTILLIQSLIRLNKHTIWLQEHLDHREKLTLTVTDSMCSNHSVSVPPAHSRLHMLTGTHTLPSSRYTCRQQMDNITPSKHLPHHTTTDTLLNMAHTLRSMVRLLLKLTILLTTLHRSLALLLKGLERVAIKPINLMKLVSNLKILV